jgi:hypothetical protein
MADYAMFLASNAAGNLDTAVDNGVWGWTDLVLDSPGQIHSGTTGRERVEALQPGDRLWIATGRPGASITRRFDPTRPVVLSRLIECRVTSPMYSDNSSVWEPDPDKYSQRVNFEVSSERFDVGSDDAGAALVRAMTDSLNRSGTPFPVGGHTAAEHHDGSAGVFVTPPPMTAGPPQAQTRFVVREPGHDYLADAVRRGHIGEAGEGFVVEAERQRLRDAGRTDLADRVDWVAKTVGDGLGYDVLSFNERDGTELHIEVKATVGSITEPFLVTRAEVNYSKAAGDKYRLYRVFNLETSPRIYVLAGDLEQHFTLVPATYTAHR